MLNPNTDLHTLLTQVMAWALSCLIVGALLREFHFGFKEIAWGGRLLGLAGTTLLICFCYHSQSVCETTQARKAIKADGVMVSEAVNRIETKSGTVIEWVNHDRRTVGLSGAVDCIGSSGVRRRAGITLSGGAGAGSSGLPRRAL